MTAGRNALSAPLLVGSDPLRIKERPERLLMFQQFAPGAYPPLPVFAACLPSCHYQTDPVVVS